MSYTLLDLWEMDVNSTNIIPIISFTIIIISVLFQTISVIKKRIWLIVPSIILTVCFLFTQTLEFVLIHAIASVIPYFMLTNEIS